MLGRLGRRGTSLVVLLGVLLGVAVASVWLAVRDPAAAPPAAGAAAAGAAVVELAPLVETDSLPGEGDIADDAAIWVDPDDPARSVVIADSKAESGGGVGVFDMDGRLVGFRDEGMIGNVDLRTGFPTAAGPLVLVGANNRSDDTLALWRLDPATRTLSPVAARRIETIEDSYGFCLYHSRVDGAFYAFVTPHGKGAIQQLELRDAGDGRVDARPVRRLPISSVAEGCVADDDNGTLFVGQEDVGVLRYDAEPTAGTRAVSVDAVGAGNLEADVEGMAIIDTGAGAGYLAVSSQGDSTIALYDRGGGNDFVRSARVVANGDVDEVTGSDGLAVTTEDVGTGFEEGMLVVHDESNEGGTTSNLKFAPLDDLLPTAAP